VAEQDVGPCLKARPRGSPGLIALLAAGGAPKRQNLIGLVEFAHLAFPGLDAILLLAARSSPQTLVAALGAAPSHAASLPCSQSWLQSNRSPLIARREPTPAELEQALSDELNELVSEGQRQVDWHRERDDGQVSARS
jgi:hypothetical protein